VKFIIDITKLETESDYCGHFDVQKTGEQRKFQEWILHLPRTLWEIGAHNLAASEVSFGQAYYRFLTHFLAPGYR